jgi:hypothetical protein
LTPYLVALWFYAGKMTSISLVGPLVTLFISVSFALYRSRIDRPLRTIEDRTSVSDQGNYLKRERDDGFLRRMDYVFAMLVPWGASLSITILPSLSPEGAYVGLSTRLVLLASVAVPVYYQIRAAVTDSVVNRLDAWIALVATLTTEVAVLIYAVFTSRYLMPLFVPSLMTQIQFGSILGAIDILYPWIITVLFAKRVIEFYRDSLAVRGIEVPKSLNAFRVIISFSILLSSFLAHTILFPY